MAVEFGQAPLCLELDLSTYDGHWSHVARFRDGRGWLIGATVTLESATEVYTADIAVACDEWDNPVPSFQAANLLNCSWSDMGPCHIQPPEILDDLLCEEEGRVYAQWQRETNRALQRHILATDEHIAAIERSTRIENDRRLRQIADLRRRRRLAGPATDAGMALDAIIAELDSQSDMAFDASRATIAGIRADAERMEEALWEEEDVLIELHTRFVVRWRAIGTARPDSMRQFELPGSGGISLVQRHQKELLDQSNRNAILHRQEQRRVEDALEAARRRDAVTRLVDPKPLPTAETPRPDGTRNDGSIGQIPITTKKRTAQPVHQFVGERDVLKVRLDDLELKGRKLNPGSRQYDDNARRIGILARRIRVLEFQMKGQR